jgi:CheY-like chemotaxis protein
MPKKKVLTIDDDPLIQRLFGGRLANGGYDALYAHTGDEGRAVARRLQPDLILIDVHMPGNEDGFQTAMRLRSEEETKSIPISLLSSADLSLEAEQAAKQMGIEYMHKSIEEAEFLERVKKMLGE